jgi:hypothetical protein
MSTATFEHVIVTLSLAVGAMFLVGLVVYAIAGLGTAAIAGAIAAGAVGVARALHAASLDLS